MWRKVKNLINKYSSEYEILTKDYGYSLKRKFPIVGWIFVSNKFDYVILFSLLILSTVFILFSYKIWIGLSVLLIVGFIFSRKLIHNARIFKTLEEMDL